MKSEGNSPKSQFMAFSKKLKEYLRTVTEWPVSRYNISGVH